jgi:uncharacterized protein (TIGR03663 family)
MKNRSWGTVFVLILVSAGLFRGMDLNRRPMHHDEANQAVKFGRLLEEGRYRYDPLDHHGPSLYYLTLPFAWALSGQSLAALDEGTLRMVPAFFGVVLILFLLLFGASLSPATKLAAALLAALSPLMVFYSRFYIQEMLLAAFLLGLLASLWRYTLKPSAGWALGAGLFAGLAYATKETSLILFISLAGALILTRLLEKKEGFRLRPPPAHWLIFAAAALFTVFLLFSSFLQNLRGPLDSLLAFRAYFAKASAPGWHIHPWAYYLEMLAFWKLGSGPLWSEGLILGLGLVGVAAALSGKTRPAAHPALARLICFHTLISVLIYSSIPYKTPWNSIPFYTGVLILAGLGASILVGMIPKGWARAPVLLLLAAGVLHLGLQSRRCLSPYEADPRNPYVYAHTSRDFLNLVKRIRDLAPFHPEGREMLIKVFAGPYETWPLPWYLRDWGRVGYWTEVEDREELAGVPVIIASIDLLEKLHRDIETSHVSEFYGLRPEVLISLHIRKDLWEAFLETRKNP